MPTGYFSYLNLNSIDILLNRCDKLWNCTGFWLKISSYAEQPNVHFTYEALVVMTTDSTGSYITWSTLQNYNQLEMDHLRIPTVQVFYVCACVCFS